MTHAFNNMTSKQKQYFAYRAVARYMFGDTEAYQRNLDRRAALIREMPYEEAEYAARITQVFHNMRTAFGA